MPEYPTALRGAGTVAIVYATRGLPWGQDETTGYFAMSHPWSKETYFENAYGEKYDLVFTKGGVESNLREDNFFTFGLSTEVAVPYLIPVRVVRGT